MPLRLYFDLLSQPSRAVYMFLRMNNIPFEAKPVALRKGEHLGEEYKKINPFSLVPVIDDDGFKLTESIAIVKYMIQKRGLPDHWFPAQNFKKQARVEEYLLWYHINTRFPAALLFQHLLLIPRATGKPVDHKAVDKFRQKVNTMVSRLEGYFLKDQKYLAGDEISIADIFGACELIQLYACHENALYEKSPIVKAWMERVQKDTNPYFDEAHKMVYRTNDVYKEIAAKL
ncbi:glutathione s-transferase theta-1 [Plakobranchus ocellatus]|uniref:Glutathione s-transferase theta-1 n=1 Tax=Plakobranchus ocellatus TaxID=259542 RepID=A0AAV3ZVU8_9GAST|nr:glutathione s-transferase theta-1 [Plakobranchus ocellatus]